MTPPPPPPPTYLYSLNQIFYCLEKSACFVKHTVCLVEVNTAIKHAPRSLCLDVYISQHDPCACFRLEKNI